MSVHFGGTSGAVQAGENMFLTGVRGRQTLNAVAVPSVAATASEEASHPFLCAMAASTATAVVTGSVNGVPVVGPVNVGTSGTRYVYVVSSHTVDISSNGYVMPEFATTPTYSLASGSSVPADSNTAFHLLVATYLNGMKTSQVVTSSLFVRPRDDGTGSSTAVAYWWGGTT